jgi:hypothetical protein
MGFTPALSGLAGSVPDIESIAVDLTGRILAGECIPVCISVPRVGVVEENADTSHVGVDNGPRTVERLKSMKVRVQQGNVRRSETKD